MRAIPKNIDGFLSLGRLLILTSLVSMIVGTASRVNANCYDWAQLYHRFDTHDPQDDCHFYLRHWDPNITNHDVYVTGTPPSSMSLEFSRSKAQQVWQRWREIDPRLPILTFRVGTPPQNASFIEWMNLTRFEAFVLEPLPDPEEVTVIGEAQTDAFASGHVRSIRLGLLVDEDFVIWRTTCEGTDGSDSPNCVRKGATNEFGLEQSASEMDLETALCHELGHFVPYRDVECDDVNQTAMTGAFRWTVDGRAILVRSPRQLDRNALPLLYDYPLPPGGEVEPCHGVPIFRHITASSASEGTGIRISWHDENPWLGGADYAISRADDCRGPFEYVATVSKQGGLQNHSYLDQNVPYNGTYTYKVSDSDCGVTVGEAQGGNVRGAPPLGSGGVNLAWSGEDVDGRRVSVSWNAILGASHYRVYRVLAPSFPSPCPTIDPESECPVNYCIGTFTTTSFVDHISTGASHVAYRVYAVGATGGMGGTAQASLQCEDITTSGIPAHVAMCPGGDEQHISFDVTLEEFCYAEPGASLGVFAVRQLGSDPSAKLWRVSGNVATPTDTIVASSYNPNTKIAHFDIAATSGCGTVVLRLYANGRVIVTEIPIDVRSYDMDAKSLGSVDRFDLVEMQGRVLAGGPGCGDFDWSGTTSAGDLGDFTLHYQTRDHVPRRLLVPNGGEMYAPGEVLPITWVRGLGDSARVTLRLLRSAPVDTVVIASNLLDTGSYAWTVPPSVVSGNQYRVQVVHTAGYYGVDYRDVGMDASDLPITIRPIAVSNAATTAGRHSITLSWTEPTQAGGSALSYDIRYKVNGTITETSFGTEQAVSGIPTPVNGYTYCLDINAQTCKLYTFAFKTAKNVSLSKMILVSATTMCSGFQEVLCEGGLLGGGGGEESSKFGDIASAVGEFDAENSLLGGASRDYQRDLIKVRGNAGPIGREYVVRLRKVGSNEVEVDEAQLWAVDHDPEVEAIAGSGSVFIGVPSPVTSVRDDGGQAVPGLRDSVADGTFESNRLQALVVDLGAASADAALIVSCSGPAVEGSADSSGIAVQVPRGDGSWETVEAIHPRRGEDLHGVDARGHARLRLAFLGSYKIHSLKKLTVTERVTPQPLGFARATHSRLGDVRASLDRSGGPSTVLRAGDDVQLAFAATSVPAGKTRDLFLVARGAHRRASAGGSPIETSAESVQPIAFSFSLGPARPNPTSGSVTFSYTLASESDVQMRVYDVTGRLVKGVVNEAQGAGVHEAIWDGRTDAGQRVPPGVYFYRLEAGGWHSERKLIVITR